jgi:hypothetical protein
LQFLAAAHAKVCCKLFLVSACIGRVSTLGEIENQFVTLTADYALSQSPFAIKAKKKDRGSAILGKATGRLLVLNAGVVSI